MFTVEFAIVVLCGVVYWTAQRVVAELKTARQEAATTRAITMMQLFARGMSEAAGDPRALLVWYPLAKIARAMDPTVFARLDRAFERTFPFSHEQVETAHAQWTADWLAWERTHDAEYKLKAAAIEDELGSDGARSAMLRARLDAVEREKLDSYQRRYQEYVQIAKALQALT